MPAFLRRQLLVATKITNIDDLILRLRLFIHPGNFLLYYIFALDLSMISYYNIASTKSYFFYERNFL